MKALYLSILLILSFLEVASQQLPDSFEYTATYVRVLHTERITSFKVFKGEQNDYQQLQGQPGIIGTITKDDTHITFTPFVPFDLESPFTIAYNQEVFSFTIARDHTASMLEVTGMYPAVNQVPSNILKWYIQFSKPVNPVKIYEHIHFLDAQSKPIDRAILNLGAPLLSADGTLLTVWVEPGRQKRLLGPNTLLGSVFEPDKNYTLHIANTLKDVQGLPIKNAIVHHFSTVASDRIQPSITQWELKPLESNTKKALEIQCSEQLDYGSLLDAFTVYYKGNAVAGNVSWDSNLQTIQFNPSTNWIKGDYKIKIEVTLEDLAGNNLERLFDQPLEQELSTSPQLILKFTVD